MNEKYNRYKDSGVEWLGMVPEHWEIKKMRFLFSFTKGLTITKANLENEGIPCVNYGEIHSKYGFEVNPDLHPLMNVSPDFLKENSNSLVNYGDFIFADTSEDLEGSGNFTHSSYKGNLFAGYHTIITRPLNGINSRYYAYIFDSASYRNQIRTLMKGVKVYSITQTVLKDIFCWIPSEKEQTSIASFLDKKTSQIDHAIELKEKTIALLKEHKQIMIQELVTGKVVIDNGEKVIDNGELKIDNARLIKRDEAEMKDSGVEWIGMVPKSWEVKRLKTLGYIYSGLSGKNGNDFSIENIESMKPFIPFTNIYRNLKINTTQYQYVKIGDFEMQNRVIKNDLLFLMSSETLEDIGKSAIYLGKDDELYLNSFCRGFRITNNQAYPEYINYLLNSQSYQDYFSIVARGFTRINLKQEYVNDASILLPDLATQHEIVDFLDKYDININKAITLQEQEIEKLKELKATLIDSAVTGKIKIVDN